MRVIQFSQFGDPSQLQMALGLDREGIWGTGEEAELGRRSTREVAGIENRTEATCQNAEAPWCRFSFRIHQFKYHSLA